MTKDSNRSTPPEHPPTTPRGRRFDPRLLALLALLPVLVAVWLPLLRGAPSPAAGSPPDNAAAPWQAAPMAEAAIALPAGSPAAVARFGAQLRADLAPYEPRWQPPTADSSAAGLLTNSPPRAGDTTTNLPPELIPSAILLSPGSPAVAIVRGLPRTVGDDIGGHTLVAIEEGCVHYRRGSSAFTAHLPVTGLGVRR